MTQSLLAVKNLTVKFGGLTALSNVSIEVNEGEVVGLIGPNGAGKTTLFNSICGLAPVNSGTISIRGKETDWPKPHQLVDHLISRTLQGVGLFPGMSVMENVKIGAHRHAKSSLMHSVFALDKKDESQLEERSAKALERVYASSLGHRQADALPYPVQKRIAIARALVNNPQLLLLDEPAGGLGHQDIEWMNSLIKNLKVETSILLVEHHMDVVMNVCDRIYVLNFGEVIAHGTPQEVRHNPDVIAAYLGADA